MGLDKIVSVGTKPHQVSAAASPTPGIQALLGPAAAPAPSPAAQYLQQLQQTMGSLRGY